MPRTRSPEKRHTISSAANELFLVEGFAGTSMESVAARARVSKPTLYNHFADKQELFAAIVRELVCGLTEPLCEQLLALPDGEAEQHLRGVAELLLAAAMQPRRVQLRRLVISEAARFPELAREYDELGPQRTTAAVARTFKRLANREQLRLAHPRRAAAQFISLVLAGPLERVMLGGEGRPPKRKELRRHADQATRLFVSAYGAR